jgi:hypothetical protein
VAWSAYRLDSLAMNMTVAMTKKDNSPLILNAVKALTKRRVLVGFPKSTTARKDEPITNASLAYIHDNGSPLQNIPKREFMRPGIQEGREKINAQLKRAGKASLEGDKQGVENGLIGAGLAGQASIRKKIVDGPFTPLKPATIAARKRHGFQGTKPLTVTGQLRNATSFIVE